MIDGPNEYTYVNQNPWTKFDPEGLNETFGNFTGSFLLPDPVGDWNAENASAAQLVNGNGVLEHTEGGLGVFANGVFFVADFVPGVGALEKTIVKNVGENVVKQTVETEGKQVIETGTKNVEDKAGQDVQKAADVNGSNKPNADSPGGKTAKDEAPAPPDNEPPGGGCFTAGTLVSTPHGDVPIERIHAGDIVCSLDVKHHKLELKKVNSTFSHVTEYWVDVSLGSEKITATRGHRFWVESLKKWVRAMDLKPGMKLLSSSGHVREITQVRIRHLAKDETTYNFFVDKDHVYFVGNNHWLVHNGDGDGDETTPQPEKTPEATPPPQPNRVPPEPGGSPALPGDPYSPAEVNKRQSALRDQMGLPKDPNVPIPDQSPGRNIKSTHDAKEDMGHEERNSNSKEEHSRVAKGSGGMKKC